MHFFFVAKHKTNLKQNAEYLCMCCSMFWDAIQLLCNINL